MSKAKKYTGNYPRKVVATQRGLFGRMREVGAVFMISKKEQFSERWMRDAKKGPVVREEVEEEILDETPEEVEEEEMEEYGPQDGDGDFTEE